MSGTSDQSHISQSFIVFDVETTGFKPEEGHEILEIGAEKLARKVVVEQFHALLLCDREIPESAIKVHGITRDLLDREGQDAREVIEEFFSFIQGAVLVGHNVGFDMAFLAAYADRFSLPKPQNQTLDTCEIARRHLIIPSYSLERVANYFGILHEHAHRARSDVAVTRQVFLKLLERAVLNRRTGA